MACNVAVHGPRCVSEGSNFMRQAPYQTVMCPIHSIRHQPADVSNHKDLKALSSQMAASSSTEKASVHWLKVRSQDAATQSISGGGILRLDSGEIRPRAHSRVSLQVHFVDVADEQQKKENDPSGNRAVSDFSASTSSSIGQASEDSARALSCDLPTEEVEVQSRLRSPLDQMSSLEDSLPVKRGLSKFFSGKSRSFSAVSDVNSIRELEKPENPYAKKRKWLHGHGKVHGNHIGCPPLNSYRGDISKMSLASGRSIASFPMESCMPGKKIRVEASSAFCDVPHRIFSPRSFSLLDLNSAG